MIRRIVLGLAALLAGPAFASPAQAAVCNDRRVVTPPGTAVEIVLDCHAVNSPTRLELVGPGPRHGGVTAGTMLPGHPQATPPDGKWTMTYTPSPGWSGWDRWRYMIVDDEGEGARFVDVEVATGRRPVCWDTARTVPGDEDVELRPEDVPCSDPDGDPLEVVSYGAWTGSVFGTHLFRPLNGTYVDQWSMKACDGTLCSTAKGRVRFDVQRAGSASRPMPKAPYCGTSERLEVEPGGALALGGECRDPDAGDTLTIVEVPSENPEYGTLTPGFPAVFRPAPGFTGIARLSYAAVDSHGVASEPREALISVARAAFCPDAAFTVMAGHEIELTEAAIGCTVPDGHQFAQYFHRDRMDPALHTHPDGSQWYEPQPGFLGTETIGTSACTRYTCRSRQGTITIDVIPDPDAPPEPTPAPTPEATATPLPTPAPSPEAPAVTAEVKGQKLLVYSRTSGTATVTLKAERRQARRLKLPATVGRVKVKVRAGRSTVPLRLSPKVRRTLRRTGRTTLRALADVAIDAGGRRTSASLAVTLRR